MNGYKIVTLNANGLRLAPKRKALFSKLQRMKVDYIFLQETHSTLQDQRIWLSQWGGQGIFAHGKSNSKGVGILFKQGLHPQVTNTIRDPDGRFLVVQFQQDDEQITLLNVYAPTQSEPNSQLAFIEKLHTTLGNIQIQTLLVAGDFNVQLDFSSAKYGSPTSRYVDQINALLEDYNLIDIWRKKNPSSKKGTFHRGSYSARLDYIFIPDCLSTSVSSLNIIHEPLSDHCRLEMGVNSSAPRRGPGYWRFNNYWLTDNDFTEEMRVRIQNAMEDDMTNPNTRWEWVKYKIREFSIAYTIRRSREQKTWIAQAEKRLLLLTENEEPAPEVVLEISSLKRELAEVEKHKANRALFKSKANWMQLGERPTAFFLGLEKRQYKDKTITSIKDDDGRIRTTNDDILEYERKYFSSIYKEDPAALGPLEDLDVLKEHIPQVSPAHRQMNDLPFSHRDFLFALKQLNKNKTPGSDGITPEFYLHFWEELHQLFFDSIMYSMEQGSLTEEQRSGVITLIPKKSQDRLYLKNWRPITLLNSDFKIFSKALANRIQSCIKDVVHTDQTGFIRGRSIATNLTSIQTVIDQVQESDSHGIILAADYEKAFDTVRWSLIHHALDVFGFGEHISGAVKLLFNDVKTCVFNSGYTSGFFNPTRGIRQGCCCSPSLFVLAVELLAIQIRNSTDVQGIRIASQEIKMSQYADDSTFFIHGIPALRHLLRILSAFANISGLRLNYQKSYLLLLGNHLHPPTHFRGIQIVEEVKILGLVFKDGMTDEQQYLLNFAPKLKQIQNICSTWLNRNLSMKGKVVLITSLMASILQYPCSCTYTPVRVILEFKRIITDFFWNGKKSKVSYRVLIQDISDGGMKLPDLQTRIQSIHLHWIRHMWNNPTSVMAQVLQERCAIPDMYFLLSCKTDLSKRIEGNCIFLQQVLATWARFHIHPPSSEEDVQKEQIWENDFVLIGKKPFTWNVWKEAGIRYINDFLHESHARFLSQVELQEKFGIAISFLQLLQIRTALPCSWKRKIVGPAKQNMSSSPFIYSVEGEGIDILKQSTKSIYSSLIKYQRTSVTSQKRWAEIFPVDSSKQKEYWAEVYRAPYKSMRDTKLQAFQFRLIHRFVPCNKFLYDIKINRTDTCSFCPGTDTIQHFLFLCPVVQKFWKDLVAWFDRETELQLNVSLRSFLFGVPSDAPQANRINFLLAFFKFYVYRQKLFGQGVLSLIHVLQELRTRLQVEKYLTTIENKPAHFNRWLRIYNALG